MRIRQNFLSADGDLRTLRRGVRMVQEIGRQAPLKSFVASEMAPLSSKSSDADVDAHIRATGITVHHPLGTCRMGRASDESAVVDPELRVRGVERLRVVDASVMPDLVGGNINAPVIMIAEKAADLIRGRTPLAPSNAWSFNRQQFGQPKPQRQARPEHGAPPSRTARYMTSAMLR